MKPLPCPTAGAEPARGPGRWQSAEADEDPNSQAGERPDRLSALGPAGLALPSLLLALLLGAAAYLAGRKHLWFDELFTWHYARLPEFGDVLSALREGAEPLPPFFYLVTRGSLWLLGDDPPALRAPAIAGVALAVACAYAFVARRTTPWHGLLAGLILLSTTAFGFAIEARPYGLVLGFSALALVSWQHRSERPDSLVAVVGLVGGLTLAVASHYQAAFVLLPLGLGEALRTRRRGHVDRLVAAAFVPPLAVLAASTPLIAAARRFADVFWTASAPASGLEFFGWAVRTAAVPPGRITIGEATAWTFTAAALAVLVLIPRGGTTRAWGTRTLFAGAAVTVVAALALTLRQGSATAAVAAALLTAGLLAGWPLLARARRVLPPEELAAAAGFLLLPVVVATAGLGTGAYVHRYALPAVLGLALLPACALHAVAPSGRLAVGSALLLAGLWTSAVFVWTNREISANRVDEQRTIAFLQRTAATSRLPIAVASPHTFLELSHYAPEPLARRLVGVADPEAALEIVGSNSTESALLALGTDGTLRVRTLETLTAPYLLLETPYFRASVVEALRRRNQPLVSIARDGDRTLYAVRSGRGGRS